MLKKIKDKLKSRAGLTLTEMLVTVAVLAFFSMACAIGITTALSARRDAIKISDADTLSSTIMQYISNEMRLALMQSGRTTFLEGADDEKFVYDGGSSVAGLTTGGSELYLNDDGRLMRKIGATEYEVLNESAYNTLKLDDLKFFVDGSKLGCRFKVVDAEGHTVKYTKNADGTGDTEYIEFWVTPINPIT